MSCSPSSPEIVAGGLSSADAERLLAEHGPNRLAEPPGRAAWKRFLDQFRTGIVYVLMAAAVLAGVVGDLKDTIVIAVVLVINAVLGYIQEARAENAMDALRRMLVAHVRVRRDGSVEQVAADDLVPGDLVLLEAGDRVPADGTLVVAVSAAVDESTLTGESVPVDKVAAAANGGSAVPANACRAFMNTTVVRGRGELLVTETGMATEMGKVAELLAEADPGPTPLQRQLDLLGKRLSIIAVVAVSVVFVVGLAQGQSLSEAVLGAVALAVAAIPEGLPAVVTVTLAVGVNQMAKRNAIVKRLHSVETLGSTTVICSDKTGTLTRNQMTARALVVGRDHLEISGEGYEPEGVFTPVTGAALPDLARALLPGALCSETTVRVDDHGVATLVGDPTEGALVVAALKAGIDVDTERVRLARVGEVPFDSGSKLMATFHLAASRGRDPFVIADGGRDGSHDGGDGADEVVVYAKGAPEIVFGRCGYYVGDGDRVQAFGPAERDAAREANEELAGRGLRVLALASRRLVAADVLGADGRITGPDDWVHDLTLEALVGVVDPPRAEARDAVGLCKSAGIAVKMITGDHATTAAAIADDLGIGGRVVTGDELSAMSDEDLTESIDSIGVCARVSPEHKVRVVRALKAKGHVVAMTGDGVNDAAALRAADIGVAMGITGTEVTKEAGDMVLADDDFATIVGAVERGRTIYDNIVKFVRFQLSTNLGAITTMLAASLLGMPTPFTPVQVLWVNLIADGPPAMTLGVDPPGRRVMQHRPRSQDEAILGGRRVARLLFFGVVMAIGTLGLFTYADRRWGADVAGTMAFNTFVLFQMFNVFNARRERGSVFSRYSLSNPSVWLAVGGVVALQVLAVRWAPLQAVFDTQPMTFEQFLLCVVVASTVLWAEELRKLAARGLSRRGART